MNRKEWLEGYRTITRKEILDILLVTSIPIIGNIAVWIAYFLTYSDRSQILASQNWKYPTKNDKK